MHTGKVQILYVRVLSFEASCYSEQRLEDDLRFYKVSAMFCFCANDEMKQNCDRTGGLWDLPILSILPNVPYFTAERGRPFLAYASIFLLDKSQ